MLTAADQTHLAAELQKALGHLQSRRVAEAEAILLPLRKRFPQEPDVMQLSGLAARMMGDNRQAVLLMRASLALNAAQPAVLNNLGNALKDLGDLAEARKAYETAIRQSPNYAEAHANLAALERQVGRAKEAEAAARHALALAPAHAGAQLTLALALMDAGHTEESREGFRALAALPGGAVKAHLGLGQLERKAGALGAARAAFDELLRLDPNNADALNGIGNLHWDAEEFDAALAAYRRAVHVRPDHEEAHRSITRILWSQGRKGEMFNALKEAMARSPRAARLHALAAETHQMLGDDPSTEQELRAALERAPGDIRLKARLATQIAKRGRLGEAIAIYQAADAAGPLDAETLADWAQAHIWAEDFDAALKLVRRSLKLEPHDQRTIAFEAWCHRAKGDAEANRLNDYKRFISAEFVRLPTDYPDFATFNAAIEEALIPLHKSKEHPIEQTLRNGTQTLGNLFPRPEPALKSVETAILERVRDYIRQLPDDPSHPHLNRKSARIKFSGSWSVRLRSGGFHTDHVHPAGWISGCYYVHVPKIVAGSNTHQGWIKFGDAGRTLTRNFEFEDIVEPKGGLLVLFPSYMWHGTVPFESEEFRTTIAFDIVPA